MFTDAISVLFPYANYKFLNKKVQNLKTSNQKSAANSNKKVNHKHQ